MLAAEDNQAKLPGELNLLSLDVDVPGGPLYRWYPYSNDLLATRRGVALSETVTIEGALAQRPLGETDFALVKIERESGKLFTGADIAATNQVPDDKGGAAVGVTMRADRAS